MQTPEFKQAQILRDNGDIDNAVALYKKVRKAALETDDILTASECLHMIGVSYYQTKKNKLATRYLDEAKKEFESQKRVDFLGFVLRDLGLVALSERKFLRAKELLVKSSELLKDVNEGHYAITLSKLSRVYFELGEYDDSKMLITKAISILLKSKEGFFLSSAYLDYAKILIKCGNLTEASTNLLLSRKVLDSFSKPSDFKMRRDEIEKLIKKIEK